jgi:hypothetical protein
LAHPAEQARRGAASARVVIGRGEASPESAPNGIDSDGEEFDMDLDGDGFDEDDDFEVMESRAQPCADQLTQRERTADINESEARPVT